MHPYTRGIHKDGFSSVFAVVKGFPVANTIDSSLNI